MEGSGWDGQGEITSHPSFLPFLSLPLTLSIPLLPYPSSIPLTFPFYPFPHQHNTRPTFAELVSPDVGFLRAGGEVAGQVAGDARGKG